VNDKELRDAVEAAVRLTYTALVKDPAQGPYGSDVDALVEWVLPVVLRGVCPEWQPEGLCSGDCPEGATVVEPPGVCTTCEDRGYVFGHGPDGEPAGDPCPDCASDAEEAAEANLQTVPATTRQRDKAMIHAVAHKCWRWGWDVYTVGRFHDCIVADDESDEGPTRRWISDTHGDREMPPKDATGCPSWKPKG